MNHCFIHVAFKVIHHLCVLSSLRKTTLSVLFIQTQVHEWPHCLSHFSHSVDYIYIHLLTEAFALIGCATLYIHGSLQA